MNKEYMYVDGKVIVSNENGMKPPIDYSDNIDDILVTENLIEEIEVNLVDRQKELEKNKSYKKGAKMHAIMPVTVFGIGSLVIPSILMPLLGDNPVSETIFGVSMHTSTVMTIVEFPLFTFVGGMMSLLLYSKYKDIKNGIKGRENEVKFLAKQLSKEKEKLNELQNAKTREKEDELSETFSSKKVNDKEVLEELKKLLYLYYNCGAKEKKYLRCQANGTLKKKLAKEKYTEYGIELIEEYLNEISLLSPIEEKGQARVLKSKERQ